MPLQETVPAAPGIVDGRGRIEGKKPGRRPRPRPRPDRLLATLSRDRLLDAKRREELGELVAEARNVMQEIVAGGSA